MTDFKHYSDIISKKIRYVCFSYVIQKLVFFHEVLSYSFPFNLHLGRISDLQKGHKNSAEFQNTLHSASLIVSILCNHQHKDNKTDSLNLTYKSYLNLTSSSTSTSFSVLRIHPISHIVFSCHSSVVFTTLWQFLNLPLCFMILMLLKSQLLCRMPFQIGFVWCILTTRLRWCIFWQEYYKSYMYPCHFIRLEGIWCPSFLTWLEWCLLDFHSKMEWLFFM